MIFLRSQKKWLFLMMCLWLTACQLSFSGKNAPKAIDGVLDLSHWDFQKDGPAKLDGEWEFYWKQLLQPKDFSTGKPPEKTGNIRIPSAWNSYQVDGKSLGGNGFATFYLKIKLPPSSEQTTQQTLAFKFSLVREAMNLYANGTLVSVSGQVGNSLQNSLPIAVAHTASFLPQSSSLELVLQVSNFHEPQGGVVTSIDFGAEQQIRTLREMNLAYDLFLFGSILLMGSYHLMLYAFRRNDPSTLYFGILCLLMAVRALLVNELYLWGIFSAQWELLYKVEYLTVFWGIFILSWFIFETFPRIFSKKILWLLTGINLGYSVFVLFMPLKIYGHSLESFRFILVVEMIYFLYVVVLAWRKKQEGALIFLLGFAFLILTVINDVLTDFEIISTRYYASLGILVFIFSQAYFLTLQFTRAFAKIQTLTEAYEPFFPKQMLSELGKEDVIGLHLGECVERKNMTILFADIRAFTTLSETLTPQENFNFLNSYLKRMTPSIYENKGIIDQYIGDAIMALFPENSDDALKAAIRMQQELVQYNQHRQSVHYAPIKIGAGINTGRIMLGTIGAQERMQETVIGDAVNIAARLQELTKQYPTNILISDSTFHSLENPKDFDLKLVDRVTMRGKTKPVAIWSVLDGDLPEVRTATFENQTLEKATSSFNPASAKELLPPKETS